MNCGIAFDDLQFWRVRVLGRKCLRGNELELCGGSSVFEGGRAELVEAGFSVVASADWQWSCEIGADR